ncbi:MAG TPA: MMPL family transporter [Deltaproteobacteria bacterium]|nr:MMPL family transporter [Deltaproteobacteria bacterium]
MIARILTRITAFTNAMTRKHLEWIFHITSRAPFKVALATILLLICSGVIIFRSGFESDIFRLFPRHLPALHLLMDSLEWTGSSREAYFLVEGDKAILPGETEKLVSRLQSLQLDGKPAFSRVTWRIYDESEGRLFAEFIAYAASNPQLFVELSGARQLIARLSPASHAASLGRVKADLSGQFGGASTMLVTADPLYLRELILPRLKAASQSLDLDTSSPYFLSRDGQVMIVIAEPARPVQDMEFARRLVVGINQARQGLEVSVSCAGAHMSAVLDEAEMKTNILACILSSLVVVLMIFYSVYRRLLPTLLLPLIVAVGVVLALATAALLLPSIHIISFAFMALIIGLGTDYSVHLYDRYHCERVAGRDMMAAIRLAVVDTGHGIFTAATTTALPFLALIISDVRALYELGLLVGLGVLFSMYATFFFLPPLLIYMERRFPAPFSPIPAVGMRALWRWTGTHPRLVVVATILLLLGGGVATSRLSFDGELKNLQPRHSEAFKAQEKIERHLSLAPRQLLIAIDGTEVSQVMSGLGRGGQLAERYRNAGRIRGWSSLGQVINSREEQQQLISSMSCLDMGAATVSLKVALEQAGFETTPFQPFTKAMASFGKSGPQAETEAIARLAASPLRGVVNRHLVKDKSGYHGLMYVFYADDELELERFVADLKASVPGVRVTGVELVSSQLAESVAHSFMWSFLLGGAIVLFLLVTHFESGRGIFYTLFPVGGGALMMLGSMAVLGIGINFMNAMVLVTIVGMGSDYGLHVAHRVSNSGNGEAAESFVQAGRAVLISALTSIAGFGSLAFADYPALASIGWGTNLGVGFTALFALVTLPAILVARRSTR